MGVAEFFDTILPSAGLRCMALPYVAHPGFKHVFGDTNAWLAEASAYRDGRYGDNVYFACASYKDTSSRKHANVAYVRSFWADVDCGAGKPYASAREGAAAVLAFSLKLGLPRPYLVSSGRGVHAYWPMDADMTPDVWKTTARILKAALKEEGVYADPSRTADEASVLRPPGTTHRKAEPRPVRVAVRGDVGVLADFQTRLFPYARHVAVSSGGADDFLPEGGPAAGVHGGNSDLTAGVEHRPSSGHAIADKCGIIGMLRDTGGAVDQPTWYFSLGVLAFTEESDALCHEWSSGDPRYTFEETDRKLAQIRANQKPTSCEKLGEQHSSICDVCPFNGKIKTPYSLGMAEPAQPEAVKVEVEEHVRTSTGGWTLKKVEVEAPQGFKYILDGGRTVMQVMVPEKDDDGEIVDWVGDTFCETLVMPITRLWIEGVAYVECEMDLKGGEKRRFLLEGGMIGKGKDTLAAELGRNEVVCKSGKGRAMDSYMGTWMQRLKDEAEQVIAHRHFGWSDRSFVLGDTVIHPDGTETRAVLVGMAKSRGSAVSASGDLQTWVDVVDRAYNAPGQEGFQFLVANSFAAPLLAMMQQVNGVTVYAHTEGSGAGKTTAQKVGLSAWGDADELMLADKKVTANALWGLMGAYNNLPIVFDELTNTSNDVASDLVFSVSSGRSKQRMQANGEMRDNNANWCTIMMASGNNLLSEKLALHRGNAEAEISRLFEFTLHAKPHLTPNEANSLFPQLRTHHGEAGRTYARYVVQNYDLVTAMLKKTQEALNTQLGITQVERYWSALLAATLVAVAVCRTLGLLRFELAPLRQWMVERLSENRVQKDEAANDPLELFGKMLSDMWEGVLVTVGEGDMRRNMVAQVVQKPRGALVGRAILPAKNEVPVLLLNSQAVKDWANRRGVSAKEMFRSLVAAGWADSQDVRYSLGKGTVEYSQTSSYIRCWKLDPEKVGLDTGHLVAQKFGVINGGSAVGATGVR